MSNLNVEDQKDSESSNPKPAVSKDAEVDTSHVEEQQTTNSDKPEEPRNQIRQTVYSKMYILCRELCFLLLLVFTYAAFQNNTPKISKSPNAYPFFPSGSIVKDWYRGELSRAIELASESDLAFVMYYAPWDAESQTVRAEFDIAAQHMHKYIHFAAINCWHPGSECRQQYSKVYSWPVLMAYPAHGRGIQYRGPRKAEYMLSFLQSVANPLTRIEHAGNIVNHEPWHDALVVGYVDAKLGSSRYGVFYTAALRFLERDPFREVQFLVVTNELFSTIGTPLLELHLWNETLVYPNENEWRPEAIISWISEHLHQVSVWASVPGGKSQSLSNYLQPGPALILFTPRNPLYSILDYYTVLHEVALDYYNCHNNLKIKIYKAHTWGQRKEYHRVHKQLETKCLTTKKVKKEKFPTIVTYDVHKLWLNNTCDFTNTAPKLSVCAGKSVQKDACANLVESPVILDKESYKKKHMKNTKGYSSIFTENNDPRSPENLLKLAETERCHFFRIAHKLQPALFAPFIFSPESKVTGLACKTNMSLSFLALDSMQHHHFAEALGVDLQSRDDKSAVVIINPALETHHVLEDSFSVTNLQRFIYDFTSGVLDRTLGSIEIARQHTHQYKHRVTCQPNHTNDDVCVHELTTSNFLPTILQPDRAVIVLYHSVKCAFCSGVSHALLTTARTLSAVTDLQFARIDGDNHALPWEFAMHHFPSILFFPTRRKSESRVFPQNVPITVPNIVSFILANVESNMKLKIMWTICSQTKFDEDLQKCVTSLRIESMTLVGRLLRVYRFSTDVHYRTALLKQLQTLRSLHFLLEHSPDMNAVQKQISLLRPLNVSSRKRKREGAL